MSDRQRVSELDAPPAPLASESPLLPEHPSDPWRPSQTQQRRFLANVAPPQFTRAISDSEHSASEVLRLPPAQGAESHGSARLQPSQYGTESSLAFSLGALERPALPAVEADSAPQPPVPSQLAHARNDIHDGAARTREPGLRDLAESFAGDGSTEAVAVRLLTQHAPLTPAAYTALLRAVLLTWRADPESLPQRVQLTKWLQGLLDVSKQQHASALSEALRQNAACGEALRARAAAISAALHVVAGSKDGAVPSHRYELPGSADFLDNQSRTGWLLAEHARCVAASDALRAQSSFTGLLRVTLHSVRGLRGGRVKRLAKLACCGAPGATDLGAPYFKLWIHGTGHEQCDLFRWTAHSEVSLRVSAKLSRLQCC